jgi:hypothetical protein
MRTGSRRRRSASGRRARLGHGGGIIVLAVSVLLVAGCAGRSPGTRSPEPTQAAVDGTVMLVPADFGSGWRVRTTEPHTSPPGWHWALSQCVLYNASEYPAQQHRTAAGSESFHQGTRREASQLVESFETGWGARSLDDIRRVLETCARYEYSDAKTEFLESHRIVDNGFGGDEALLVETVRIAPPHPTTLRHTAVIRRGDLVVTVTGTGLTADEVRRLAVLATGRLA